ncbi:MAG TPA: YitT family protein [Anaerolinea thermolimosa]|uniref:YitT family protein n=1 Tax=Anaerolinea thermolimosa TaxID=229919 RepID=A0A3D1JJR6_9CHLR|nr:YitT family protein [Anaerolinea thermolimosa]
MKPLAPLTLRENLIQTLRSIEFSRDSLADYTYVLLGALVQAFAMRLFLVPAQLVSGGISGASQLINFYTGWPIGLMVFLGNVPLFLLGWQHLGGPRFALRTALAVTGFSFFTDMLGVFLPPEGIVHDLFLNCLYGAVVLGVGLGMVYRGKGTSGGSDILGRILNEKIGISISMAYLITDSIVILASGLVFAWENALYALAVTYVSGLVAEMVLEGTSVFRTALIITSRPEEVAQKIMTDLERGVTILNATGAYTHTERPVLYCVVTRPEVSRIKAIVKEVNPRAFMVIGQAHEALGEGFRPLQ